MKKLISLVLIFGGLFMLSNTANAASGDKIPGESVYASSSEQAYIYSIVHKSEPFMNHLEVDGINILKESITPVFVANLFDYAETGEFEVNSSVISKGKTIENQTGVAGNDFIAKTVTAEGLFAGNIRFYIEDDTATIINFIPSAQLEHYFDPDYGPGSNALLESRSYFDHALKLQNLTVRSSLVPASEVRYVMVRNLGEGFYVNDGKQESLVMLSYSYGVSGEYCKEIFYVDDEFKNMANEMLAEHKALLANIEEWKASHPGEEYLFDGGGYVPLVTVDINKVEDVNEVANYLAFGNDLDVGENASEKEPALKPETIFAIIAVALLIAFTTLAVFKVMKTKILSSIF